MPISIGALRAASSRFVKTASNLAEARSLALQTVFLCHSHHDEQLVKGLMSLFREQGWRVYVDWEDAAMPETPTRETAARIQQKIRELDYFVFLATANSVKSRWCPWEIGFADSAKSLVPDILKIEDVNFIDSNSRKPFRQLFGYAISAKRYALYTKTGNDILIEKASGHGLGYLFAPKERKEDEESDEEEVPPWVIEAWDFLLRKELQLTAKEPSWLDSPAMMRMVVTTPNVLKNQRPEWLGPFNFFLFPIISELGGYPAGFDKSNFLFITPIESDRRKWRTLVGINLIDRQTYQISMSTSGRQDKVIPDSFRIILNQYPKKEEAKSLSPDGSPCTGTTRGLLRRVRIVAGKIIPVGKETDRRWEQGEDPSMIDSSICVHEPQKKMCVADPSERKRWSQIGVRKLMRESNFSQKAVYAILTGRPVRVQTLAIFRQAADKITA